MTSEIRAAIYALAVSIMSILAIYFGLSEEIVAAVLAVVSAGLGLLALIYVGDRGASKPLD